MSMEVSIMEEQVLSGSEAESTAGSPRSKVKFLCSHGGRILPRPADGHLKYVGGETRVISIHRDITYPELMKKLSNLVEGDIVLKYQLIPEDLDALVSVKSDEDLRHMLEEYDRHESMGSPRLRSYLFPANPVEVDNSSSTDPRALEQRYIDAVNGIIRSPSTSRRKPPPLNLGHLSTLSISSACSSPRSPDSCTCTTDFVPGNEAMLLHSIHNRFNMQKVHSSPSLCNLNAAGQCHGASSPNQMPQHPHHNQNYLQQPHQQHHGSYQSSKPPLKYSSGHEHLIKVRSVGRAESTRYQVDHYPPYNYSVMPRSRSGNGRCTKCMYLDEYGVYTEKNRKSPVSSPESPLLREQGMGSACHCTGQLN